MLPWSVTATDFMPRAATVWHKSFVRIAPSSRLYCECRCRCAKSERSALLDSGVTSDMPGSGRTVAHPSSGGHRVGIGGPAPSARVAAFRTIVGPWRRDLTPPLQRVGRILNLAGLMQRTLALVKPDAFAAGHAG